MYLRDTPICPCFSCVPKRFLVMIFLMWALALSFLYRLCLVLTIAQFVESDKPRPTSSDSCGPTTPQEDQRRALYNWPQSGVGHTLAAYFYGYSGGLLLSGLLSDRFGGKILCSLGMLFSSLVTVLTPLGFLWGYGGVISLRVPFGFFQAMVTIAAHVLLTRWIPRKERGVWVTIVFGGVLLGHAINSLVTPRLFEAFGEDFQYTFLCFGLVGFIWVVLFVCFCGTDPDHDKYISEKEKNKLEQNMTMQRLSLESRRSFYFFANPPWKKILTCVPLWVCTFANFGFHWYVYGVTNQVPIFLKAVYHLPLTTIGFINLSMAIGEFTVAVLASLLVDYIERNKKMPTTLNRKVFYALTVALTASPLLSPLIGCQLYAVVVIMTLGLSFTGFYYPSLKVNYVDFSPRYAGTVTGICHSVAITGAILSNTVFGYIVPKNYLSEWQTNFCVISGVYVLSSIPFFIWGSGEVQPWNEYTAEPKLSTDVPRKKHIISILK